MNFLSSPGFWLNTSALALSVMDEAGADNPGRIESGTGEIN